MPSSHSFPSPRDTSLTALRHYPRARHGAVPIGAGCLVLLAILFSLLFILCITLAFIGAEEGLYFKKILDGVVQADIGSGIVLLGESVDVDIAEPAVTVRWSIVACGDGLVLPFSHDIHGSSSCGMPSVAFEVYVDNSDDPVTKYDPSKLPIDPTTRQPSDVQRLLQFDSDHILDVHNARLYPFDTYVLTSTLRLVANGRSDDGPPLVILKLPVIQTTSSFSVSASDTATLSNADDDGDLELSRDVELRIRRPGDARTYAMLLFGLNWALAHFTLGIVILALYHGQQSVSIPSLGEHAKSKSAAGAKDVLKQLAGILAIMLVIPQLRGAMPDAPDFDGALIDSIGFFPQMTLSGLSAVSLLLILVKRELERISVDEVPDAFPLVASSPSSSSILQPVQSQATATGSPQTEKVGTTDFVPLPKARSPMDVNHFRKKSVAAAELKRNASSTKHSYYSPRLSGETIRAVEGIDSYPHILPETHAYGATGGKAGIVGRADLKSAEAARNAVASLSRHPARVQQELVKPADRWTPFPRDLRGGGARPDPPRNPDHHQETDGYSDYSTGVAHQSSRSTSRFSMFNPNSFLRSRKQSFSGTQAGGRMGVALPVPVPEDTLLEVFGKKWFPRGLHSRRQSDKRSDEEDAPVRDIRYLKWS